MFFVPIILSESTSAADDIIMGTGTEEDPFLIDSVSDLRSIGTEGYGMDRSYRQIDDITFTWNDDLNTDNALTLKASIVKIDNGYMLEIRALLNNVPVVIDPETDFMSVTVNGEQSCLPGKWAVSGSIEAVFHFPAELFRPGEDNVVSVCGAASFISFGTAAVFEDVPFKMTEHIGGNFIPIGTLDEPFCGSYDGNGYSIIGMRVFTASDDPSAGMFGHTNSATISDLTLKSGENNGSYFIASSIHGTPFDTSFTSTAGSLIGSMSSTSIISVNDQNCVVVASNAETLFASPDAEDFTFVPNGIMTSSSGGIVGEGDGSITTSVQDGHTVSISVRMRNIYLEGNTDAGIVFNISSNSKMSSNAGGFVGSGSSISISNSSSEGDVFAVSYCGTYVRCRAEHVSDSSYSNYWEMQSVYSGGIVGSVDSLNAVNVSSSGGTYAMRHYECLPYTSRGIQLFGNTQRSGEMNLGGTVGYVTDEIVLKNCSVSGGVVFNEGYNRGTPIVGAGGLIGRSSAHVTKISASCATNNVNGNCAGSIGGLIGSGSPSGMDQTYYSSNSSLAPSGTHVVTENVYAKIGISDQQSLGNKWDFDRVWSLDADNRPVIDLRFNVNFVSEHDGFFDIVSTTKTGPDTYSVNGISSDFTVDLEEMASQSKVELRYENGDAIDTEGMDFVVGVLLDENGSPMDRTITVSGIELNTYSVCVPSVPDGISLSMSDETVTHGGGMNVTFSSDTHDLARLTLVSAGGNCNIADDGNGSYSVFNITGDVELSLSGYEEIGDLTDVSDLLYAAAVLISIGVMYGAIKLIRLKRIT